LRPPSAEELIDEAAFDEEEFLPYWAELWPSGLALARHLAGLELGGLRVLELGCGLGLPSLVAALRGAHVLATDWADDAIELLRRNAERNGVSLRLARVRWSEPEPLLRAAPWDIVLGADLLYEQRNAEQLAALLPRLAGEVLLAEPGRPYAKQFLERFDTELVGERIYRLRYTAAAGERSLARAASHSTTPAATATLRLSTGPGSGTATCSSAASSHASGSP
jgi:predicted nicotinamide N-methyase